MLAQQTSQDKPTLRESVELYTGGSWILAYPSPLKWSEAQAIALIWKERGLTTLVEEAHSGWMVYVLAGAK